ncbi:hypothetical protein LSTR_LSTR006597 [Laodelphax striatellus]|uniref:Late endosomal/lysosomal adaptor and MAPK and MTOR activator 4 n=1 Tax=Laodelphax striatellus TaxID=195883 RepID=A0A482X160_LAOST|nr:hypothetical protein LSTR_LSTR006597 [Laodelphax striatellus]
MMALERIPDQIGYLVMKEDGAVVASGGDLENSEHVGNIVVNLITLADSVGTDHGSFKKISIVYPEFSYVICLSNKKIYIVKKRFQPVPETLPSVTVSEGNASAVSVDA